MTDNTQKNATPNSRFGGNSGQNQAKNNPAPAQPNNPAPSRPANRFSAFGRQQVGPTILPLQKTLVSFDFKGLGDPFYKVLGYELNTEYADTKNILQAFEKSGDIINELTDVLNSSWESYNFQGAILLYRWKAALLKGLTAPMPMPSGSFDFSDENEDGNDTPSPLKSQYTRLRALDLPLVLNVLARARNQVLLAEAPLVLSQQYVNRTLYTDDPRLVTLVQATGYIQEKS